MDIKITSQPAAELIDHDDIVQLLKYEDAQAAEESLIDTMCSEARVYFEKVTGLSLVEKTYQVHFRYEDKPYILPVSPVVSITSVKTVDIDGTLNELTLNSEYYKRGLYEIEVITDAETISNPFRTFGGKQDLQVIFVAGYGSNTETIPADLLGAMKKQIYQWYYNRDDFYELRLLGSIQMILNRYKKCLL